MKNKNWCALVVLAKDPTTPIETRFRAYIELLSRFDWAYNYTDDYNIWSQGIDRNIQLREIRADLYNKDPGDALITEPAQKRSPWLYEQYQKGTL